MNVVFVEPFFPSNQRQFARALAEAGATVIGIGEYGVESFDDDLKGWLDHYERVSSVTDVDAMTRAVRWVQDKLWVDRLEATIEAHTMAAAQVREACTIPGTSVRTAWLCRDKPSMKEALRQAGVPTAASAAVSSAAGARAFAAQHGYPLILKPRAGAGAAGTMRADDDAGLEHALGVFGEVMSRHFAGGKNIAEPLSESSRERRLARRRIARRRCVPAVSHGALGSDFHGIVL